jgi:Fe-S-cluster containining protein
MKKINQLSDRYTIDEAVFYQIVEHWDEQDVPIDKKLEESFKGLLHQVSVEMDKMDEIMDERPTCFMGCAFCCYFPIIVTKLEAKLIKQAIDRYPKERKETILAHLTNYQTLHEEKLKQARAIDFKEDPDFKRKYRMLDLPCPLLDLTTNSCQAYEVRPIPCRTYVNYLDPLLCEENRMPKETVSFEFLYGPYFEALNEFVQWQYEDGDTGVVNYPDDLFSEDYLINWLDLSDRKA